MEKLEKVDFCLALFDKKSKEPNWGELRARMKPGAHIVAICPKTSYHRIAERIETAGFEIPDCVLFLGSTSFLVCIGRKPRAGLIIENARRFGTGCLNIDACRVTDREMPKKWAKPRGGIWKTDSDAKAELLDSDKGGFPSNLIHSSETEIVEQFSQGAEEYHRFFKGVSEKNKVVGLCKYLCLLCATEESSVVTVNVPPLVRKALGGMVASVEEYPC